jgi:hypothetical protein
VSVIAEINNVKNVLIVLIAIKEFYGVSAIALQATLKSTHYSNHNKAQFSHLQERFLE